MTPTEALQIAQTAQRLGFTPAPIPAPIPRRVSMNDFPRTREGLLAYWRAYNHERRASSHKPIPRPRTKRNLPVKRRDYPPDYAGLLAYNRDYCRALRHAKGLGPHVRKIPVRRADYPKGQEGTRLYRHDYGVAWRKDQNGKRL